MKMFKKIMAVALTAVMAVSMLTGCAIGDAFHEKQLLNALNDAGTTTKVNGAFHKYVKDNKVTVNGVDYTLSEKATAVAKKVATKETTKNDFTNAGYVINLTDSEVAEGKYVIAAVVVPTSGDYKWNKLAGDVNAILGSGYSATATGTGRLYGSRRRCGKGCLRCGSDGCHDSADYAAGPRADL